MLKSILAVAAFIGTTAYAGDVTSLGNGASGAIQQVTGINNAATAFNAAANDWQKTWPTEKVKGSQANRSSDNMLYCLQAQKEGGEIIKKGDVIAHQYDAFIAANPGTSDNVKPAAEAQDAVLHSIFKQWQANKKASSCN